METVPCLRGDGCMEDRVEGTVTPAGAVQAGAPATPPAGTLDFEVEVVRVEKKWNIANGEIAEKIKKSILSYREGYAVLYNYDTWGSCRVTKFIVMNADGSYLDDGEWFDESSRKNVHKRKVMPLQDFLAKYAGKELLAYCYVSPSCNKSKQYSFRAVFRVVVNG
jgi:hypothetical protein